MKITVDTHGFYGVRMALSGIKDGYPKVLSRAINRTLPGVRTDSVRAVRRELNLPASRIRKDVKISKATAANPRGAFSSMGKPIGLASFTGTRQVKKGTSVKVRMDSKRTVLRHAFIATAKGAKNVFWRKRQESGKLVARLPVERLSGPRIQDILSNEKVLSNVEMQAGERFEKAMDYETSRLLKSLKAE